MLTYSDVGQNPEMAVSLSGASRGEFVSLTFQLLEVALDLTKDLERSWLMSLSSIFKSVL